MLHRYYVLTWLSNYFKLDGVIHKLRKQKLGVEKINF